MDQQVEDFRRYLAQTSPFSMEFPVWKASGIYIYDQNGKKFFDFTSGVGVANLGHSNLKVNLAVWEQINNNAHTNVYGEHIHRATVRYAKELVGTFDGDDRELQVFFTNSGNEAVDLALKIARRHSPREGLVAVEGAFHGRGYGAMQFTWNPKYTEGFRVDRSSTLWLKRNDFTDLYRVNWRRVGAVFLELVQGEAGSYALDPEWVKEIEDKCREFDVPLVIDEIQTGFGRTGTFWAQQRYGVKADVTLFGKAAGGGLPIGGVIAEKSFFEELQTPPLSHLTTFGGNPVVCAAGSAVLRSLDNRRVLGNVIGRGRQLATWLERRVDVEDGVVSDYRMTGLMGAIEFKEPLHTEEFVKGAFEKGVLLAFKLNNPLTVRLSPPLTITEEEMVEAISRMDEVLEDMEMTKRRASSDHA